MARVRSHVRIPVVAGEAIYTKSGFRAAFEKGAVDITILEYFVSFEEFGCAICPDPLKPVAGYITLPTRPGLGVEIDEAALSRYPYKPFPVRPLRQPKDEMP